MTPDRFEAAARELFNQWGWFLPKASELAAALARVHNEAIEAVKNTIVTRHTDVYGDDGSHTVRRETIVDWARINALKVQP